MSKLHENMEVNDYLQRLEYKFQAIANRIGDGFPFLEQEGRYPDITKRIPDGKGIYIWSNGFWPGMLWQMFNLTHKKEYRQLAESLGEKLSEALKHPENLSHDVGFMYMLSDVADYNLTNDIAARQRALDAADILMERFQSKGNFIRAWNESKLSDNVEGWMIVDCMMNIQLLYWASRESGDQSYASAASAHADTALAYIQRPDGSSNHIAEFSVETGEFVCAHGGQGYDKCSSWSRGQAWAAYGFALCYRNTGNQQYLDAAKRSAHYCISNLAVNDWLPLVDFKAPAEPVKYDSTAGLILVCAFEEIAQHVGEYEKSLYHKSALKTFLACADRFSNWNQENDQIMEGASLDYYNEAFADTPAIYGDYFFIEALLRLTGNEMKIW